MSSPRAWIVIFAFAACAREPARTAEPPLVAIEAAAASAPTDDDPPPRAAAPPLEEEPQRPLAEASPADRETARALMMEGTAAFDRGDVAEALDRFHRARLLVDAPTIAVMEARALLQLGRKVEAKRLLRRVITSPPQPDEPRAFTRAREEAVKLEQSFGP
jgi:predicted Zn-dependent protease